MQLLAILSTTNYGLQIKLSTGQDYNISKWTKNINIWELYCRETEILVGHKNA